MCKCNQGGRVLGIIKSPRITEVRKLLIRARFLQQQCEIARDYHMEGGPGNLKERYELYLTQAKYTRGKAKRMLVEMEKAAGREFMNGNSHLGSRANLIQGDNFRNWTEYHKTFNETRRGTTDIWR